MFFCTSSAAVTVDDVPAMGDDVCDWCDGNNVEICGGFEETDCMVLAFLQQEQMVYGGVLHGLSVINAKAALPVVYNSVIAGSLKIWELSNSLPVALKPLTTIFKDPTFLNAI